MEREREREGIVYDNTVITSIEFVITKVRIRWEIRSLFHMKATKYYYWTLLRAKLYAAVYYKGYKYLSRRKAEKLVGKFLRSFV